jgi:hypothetical protein
MGEPSKGKEKVILIEEFKGRYQEKNDSKSKTAPPQAINPH